MLDLKPCFDAARAASDAVTVILTEMKTAFDEGTEEGKLKALELRPVLDEAKIKADEANQLYVSMRDAASATDNAAKLFVPVASAENPSAKNAKEMTLDAFQSLKPADRMAYIKDGGKIIEPVEG